MFGFVSQIVIICDFIYGRWKVYHSEFYKKAVKRELEFKNSIIFEILIWIGFLVVWTVCFDVVTAFLPFVALYFLWGLIFGFL